MKGKSTGSTRASAPVLAPEDQALFLEAMGGVKPLDAPRSRAVPPRAAVVVKVVELPPEAKLDGRWRWPALRGARAPASRTRRSPSCAPARSTPRRRSISTARRSSRRSPSCASSSSNRAGIGRRCVLVVHGKGTHSEHGAPLREAVLARSCSARCSGFVHALASAAPADGGEGATYVMLRGDAMKRALALVAAARSPRSPRRRADRDARRKPRARRREAPLQAPSRGRRRKTALTRASRYGKELRPAREVVGRREEPLTLEEDTAKQIEKLLRGPLRNGVTGLFVADARTGEPLFAVNADDPLNPASNVKMISTATALELLGPTFRYTTRVLGPEPDATRHDHTATSTCSARGIRRSPSSDMDQHRRRSSRKRGVKQLDGDVLVGSDPTRDGIYRAMVPVEIKAGEPGQPPTATTPAGLRSRSTSTITAKTDKQRAQAPPADVQDRRRSRRRRPQAHQAHDRRHDRQGRRDDLPALHARAHGGRRPRAARRAARATTSRSPATSASMELGDFVGDVGQARRACRSSSRATNRSSSRTSSARSTSGAINWLADRVIMTAAALSQAHDAVDGCRDRRDVRVAAAPPAARQGLGHDRHRLGPLLPHADHAARARQGRPRRRWLHRRHATRRSARRGSTRSRSPAPTARCAAASACPTSGPHPRQDRLALDGDRAVGRARSRSDAAARVLDRHEHAAPAQEGLRPQGARAARRADREVHRGDARSRRRCRATTPVTLGTPAVLAPVVPESTPAEETAAEAAEAQPDPELDVETATSK